MPGGVKCFGGYGPLWLEAEVATSIKFARLHDLCYPFSQGGHCACRTHGVRRPVPHRGRECCARGREAKSTFTVVAALADGRAALASWQLGTGRTHQIRHAISHPVGRATVMGSWHGAGLRQQHVCICCDSHAAAAPSESCGHCAVRTQRQVSHDRAMMSYSSNNRPRGRMLQYL